MMDNTCNQYTIFMNSLRQHREYREEYLKSKSVMNRFTEEEIKKFNSNECKLEVYEAENAWWYYFFQAAGSNNYDAEYANSLRINGVLPKIAAEETKIQETNMREYQLALFESDRSGVDNRLC